MVDVPHPKHCSRCWQPQLDKGAFATMSSRFCFVYDLQSYLDALKLCYIQD